MPLREFFENDPSGAKKRLSYLKKYPDVLKTIEEWSLTYGLNILTFEEKIYHCVNEIKELPIDPKNGFLKEFRGPKKGYSKRGKPRPEKKEKTLDEIIKNFNQKGGSISQKIANSPELIAQVLKIFPQENVPFRAKIKLLIEGKTKIPKCTECNNTVSFQPSGVINSTCSNKCRRSAEQKFRSKKILFGNRYVRVQGYEELVLMELKNKYDPDDILVGDEIVTIKYDGKQYHPDLMIKSENKIIEVKSSYTFKADYEKNMRKKQAAIENGFKFEFHIWDLKQII